jgi:superfamily II DNA or RNA helicase
VQSGLIVTTARVPRLRHGDLVRIRSERWRVDRFITYDGVGIVDAVGCSPTNRAKHARFLLPFELFERLAFASRPRLVSRARWRHVARRTLATASPSWSSLGAATDANLTLIPFQLEPAMALVRGDGCRFLIADAVGLGKTIEAGLMIGETLRRRPEARTIVVTPAGLRQQWQEELRTRFSLDAEIFDAARLALMTAALAPDVNPWSARPLIITSIDYVKRPEVMRSLEALIWDLVVLDEAHHLVGRSDRANAAAMLSDRARALVLLTATPHSGDDEAFARLSELGHAGGSQPLLTFRRTRGDAGLSPTRRTSLLRVRPTPAELAMHDALAAYAKLVWRQSATAGFAGARLAVSVLMRRASSSAASLARSVARRLMLLADAPVSDAEQVALPFDEAADPDQEPGDLLRPRGLRDVADERRHLEHLLQLACTAAADESKMRCLQRFISRTNEPAVVFTEYRDTLQQLTPALSHFDAVELHGGLTASERAAALHRFTHGNARLLLATDAGSEGLNLHQRCRLVVHLELPWTPLRLEQRAGRVDRIGQQRRPHAVHLVAANTCEESTLARLVTRMARMQGALNALARFPNEQRIADCILGSHAQTELLDELPCPTAGIVVPDGRAAARDEAQRIAEARALGAQSDCTIDMHRPVIACVRQRQRTEPPRCLWAFKVELVTAAGRVVWEAMLPTVSETISVRPCSPALIRALLDPEAAAVRSVVDEGCARLVDRLTSSMQPAIERWAERECNLMAVLRARHARLSAGLLQRGLFDRRDERLAATQTSILEEALSQCAGRLRDLAQCHHPQIDSSALIFAVVFE